MRDCIGDLALLSHDFREYALANLSTADIQEFGQALAKRLPAVKRKVELAIASNMKGVTKRKIADSIFAIQVGERLQGAVAKEALRA